MQANKFVNLLILMLFMLCVSTSVSAESVVSFSDVTENHWAYSAIMNMTERGMFKGTSEAVDGVTAFSPDKTMLRSEFIAVLTRYLYSNELGLMNPSNGQWYANNYIVALKYGLLTSDELDGGELEKPCTRQEMAMLLVRAAYTGNGEVAENIIPSAKIFDYDKIAEEYKSYVLQSYTLGLLVGVDEKGTFNPEGILNRAQAATAIYRLIDTSTRVVYDRKQISFTCENGISYSGEYTNGEADGYGTMVFPDTGTYTGNFVNGKREGYGKFAWNVGDSYIGMWNSDKMCGEGTYTFSDGYTIDGIWLNNNIVIESFSMTPSSVYMTTGAEAQIMALCVPKNITENITWVSSNPDIVEVTGVYNTAYLLAISSGSAVVTAATESGSKTECMVTVTNNSAKRIELNYGDYAMNTGDDLFIEAYVTPTSFPVSELSWSTSDDSVAVVYEDGYVIAVNPGTAVISAKSPNGLIATCYVTVYDEELTLWDGNWNVYKAGESGDIKNNTSEGVCTIDIENTVYSLSLPPFHSESINLDVEDAFTISGTYATSDYYYKMTFSSISDTEILLEVVAIYIDEYSEDKVITDYYVLSR